jgi:hypothetical protein
MAKKSKVNPLDVPMEENDAGAKDVRGPESPSADPV